MHFPVKFYDKLDVSDSPKINVNFLSSNIPLSPYLNDCFITVDTPFIVYSVYQKLCSMCYFLNG
jgi:hypothetical protein